MRYSKDHQWVTIEGDIGTVGITFHAQAQLGDVVYVELPTKGRMLIAGETVCVVESVKAASEVYAPISGEVLAVNTDLSGDPGMVNRAAETEAWFFQLRVKDPSELENLMDEKAYLQLVG